MAEDSFAAGGTRFRLYPYPPFMDPQRGPETVVVSPPAGTVGPGPSDARMYTCEPIGKTQPYGDDPATGVSLPPWRGPVRPPALPDAAGHFDYLEPGTPQFEAAHLYGVVRFTLDVWEHYFERRIDFHFEDYIERLELCILRDFENATMGFGFLEAGIDRDATGHVYPFTLSFDIIAHEVGHCLVYSQVGVPRPALARAEYYGFHESAADMTALITLLHFDSVMRDLLEATSGNLYTFNELNRFGELSPSTQVRIAANNLRLSDFSDGWDDEHHLAQPLTGALFDLLIDIFHDYLVEAGAVSATAEDLSDQLEESPQYHRVIQPIFDAAFARAPEVFYQALADARDTLGIYLAECWPRLDPETLSYAAVGRHLLQVDREITGGAFQNAISVNFDWRDIGRAVVGPELPDDSEQASHAASVRTFVPGAPNSGSPLSGYFAGRRLPYRLRRKLASNFSQW